jgi:uncharacterized protein with HEPN domain
MPSKGTVAHRALEDIGHHIALAQRFTEGMDYDAFCGDERTVYAVIRCLEIISEASRRLPEELKVRHLSIAWREMAASGNIYRHQYEGVAAHAVWDTLKLHLPPLQKVIDQELARITAGL